MALATMWNSSGNSEGVEGKTENSNFYQKSRSTENFAAFQKIFHQSYSLQES